MDQGGAQSGGDAGLQFDKVELGGHQAARACRSCQQPIEREYFEIVGNVVCPSCAQRFSAARGWRAFLRAAAFGAGAALLGTLAWFAIIEIAHSEFGLLAIGVGLFVGVAVRKGSGGHGGARYQALAMALTYISITASYVPLVVRELGKRSEHSQGAHASAPNTHAGDSAALEGPERAQASAPAHHAEAAGLGTLLFSLAVVFGLAFASPFLAGFDNLMGWIIIGIALYEAWKINKSVPVSGPFQLAKAAEVPNVAPVP